MESWQEKIKEFFSAREKEDVERLRWRDKQRDIEREKWKRLDADKKTRLAEVRHALEVANIPELLEKVKKDVWRRGSIHDLLNNNYDKKFVGFELRHIRRGTTSEGGDVDISGHRSSIYSVKGWVIDSLSVSSSKDFTLSTEPQLYIADTQSFYIKSVITGGEMDHGYKSWYSRRKNIPFADRKVIGRDVEDALLQLCKERILARKLPTDRI